MIMPKKSPEKKKVSITISLEPKDVAKIDKLAKIAGFSRSKAARNTLLVGLDLISDFERFRLVSLATLVRDKHKEFKAGFRKMVLQLERADIKND
jgi:hypothetical protein